ncbi:hypothetical protein EO087_10805 [Dyella sp. M7H15-1]|uniref:hypothetical protein n=1 Tax=Dyella sp. M7H15-1 TaxID=2501295 RepID=UPI001004E177|nr:hypothetical protein [Dyella sp. M7H15-1]QAU24419.1 hypothetical protein EO087_10805 [Dyella sp. M7H15-1]
MKPFFLTKRLPRDRAVRSSGHTDAAAQRLARLHQMAAEAGVTSTSHQVAGYGCLAASMRMLVKYLDRFVPSRCLRIVVSKVMSGSPVMMHQWR